MIETGLWIGQYRYDTEQAQKMCGFESTNFEIEITKVDQNNFTGKVQDDLSTGGTEGIGDIKGKVFGEKIEFIKQMPVMTLLIGEGTRRTLNKKHPKIFYEGVFSSDRKSISGQWRFKKTFIWLGLIPLPVIPTKGTWTMTLQEQ